MSASLSFSGQTFRSLLEHLRGSQAEQVAFLFTSKPEGDDRLRVVDLYRVPPEGFEFQSDYHITLADDQRGFVISRAWEIGGALAEVHSHTGTEPPSFSWSDMAGLAEWVPHVRWRLRGLPYVALVFSNGQFDALVWRNGDRPEPLSYIQVDAKPAAYPTGITFERLRRDLQ